MNDELAGKRYVVVGLGKSGLGAIELLHRRGATVLALDENPKASVPFVGVEVAVGFPPEYWKGAEAVVVSPGVPMSKPELQAARDAGVSVFGEIELAWRFMPKGAGPILAITGTNGKSTTTALLGELVKQQFPNTFVGGNLGIAFSSAYADPARKPFDFHVVELSSFQLEGIDTAQFFGAAILNLSPDHIDRYPTHGAYGAAKALIFRTQPPGGFAVVNLDDNEVLTLAKAVHVPLFGFTRSGVRANPSFAGFAMGDGRRFVLSFGEFAPFDLKNRALRGAHNLDNAMAASLMAAKAGISHAAIQAGLDSFPGLPHRLELVRSLDGVEWINDSKATNVDSSLVAMHAFDGGLWLIAGGKGKGAPYAPLVEAAKGKVRGVLTIGADAAAISEAFKASTEVIACETLQAAVAKARVLAKSGDTVLLSPACASYDQFTNFEHRGDAFKTLVRAL